MTVNLLVPAAQYLRMSTEHQQYSLENQCGAIQKYANSQGFEVVRTYSDPAKSGLVLRHRPGLQQLLRDVVGNPAYRAILVYDVSRWGRFQDTDESAHYEFLCKAAGVPVHYCAETFSNDGTLANLIMKTVKRTMAAEYSRELGVKVLAGQKRLARLGFKQGGIPGYGLRRMLMSADLYPKQELADGERKSITTDRVILVPGPVHELQSVRDIYRMLISDKLSVHAIASELNRQGVKYLGGSAWGYQTVYAVLTHPKYAGCHVFNRTSSKLYTRTVRLPKSEWVLTPGAFKPIIDHETFSEAQRILQARTIKKSDEEVLESLRVLLASEGRLSLRLIKNSADVPSPSTYRHRFGGLRKAYQLIGYGRPDQFGPMDLRRRTQALREDLLIQIATLFPNEISIVRKGGRWRPRLRMKNGRIVTVLVARSIGTRTGHFKWQIDPIVHERHHVTLLALLDASNSVIQEMYVLSRMDRQRRFKIAADDDWLRHGELLKALAQFPEAVKTASRSEQRSSESHL